jgi:hypothetical protein
MADDDRGSSSRSGKKSTSKRSTSKKSAGSRSGGTKSASRSTSKQAASTSSGGSSSSSSSSRRSSGAPRAESTPSTPPAKIATKAAQQLLELTGRATEGVIGLEKDDDGGWRVQVEVVEVRRIPNTTDVLALYEIDADDKGNLQGYRRIRRYVRGAPDDDR